MNNFNYYVAKAFENSLYLSVFDGVVDSGFLSIIL